MNSNKDFRILLDDISQPWDLGRFEIARKPITFGRLELGSKVYQLDYLNKIPKLVEFPIKLTEEDNLRLPKDIHPIHQRFIDQCMRVEKEINKENLDKCFIYLSSHVTKLEKGEVPVCLIDDMETNNMGIHIDGLLTKRNDHKKLLPADHTYVFSNALPPQFFITGLNIDKNVDLLRNNFHLLLQEKIDKQKEVVSWAPENEAIVVYSAYQIHHMFSTAKVGWRVAFRLDVSHREFDREGNDKNPEMPKTGKWFLYFGPRNIPEAVHISRKTFINQCENCKTEQTMGKSEELCFLCARERELMDDLEKHYAAHMDSTRQKNINYQLWVIRHNPWLDFEDFCPIKVMADSEYTTSDKVQIIFASPSINGEIRACIPVKTIDKLQKEEYYGDLKFSVISKTEHEAKVETEKNKIVTRTLEIVSKQDFPTPYFPGMYGMGDY